MPFLSRINRKALETNETGLGTNSSYSGGRFFNKDGTPNIKIRGIGFFQRFSIYQTLLKLPISNFLLLIAGFYLIVNLFFACIYSCIGIDNIGGLDSTTSLGKFWEAFFFSAQTLSTVGYGHFYPIGFTANLVAAVESLLGLLMFALATGLMYGRFAQPKSYILYSKNALFAPFKDGIALMFRLAPYKKHFLTDVEVKLTLAMKVRENGTLKNQFYNLPLDIAKANTLTLNWNLVHPIDEKSPLYGLTKEEIEQVQSEILVFVKAYDEEYANTVVSRTSYTIDEFVFGARFSVIYHPDKEKNYTIIHLDQLNNYEKVELPVKF